MEIQSPYCNLLLATDGSVEARRATAHALYLARALGAKLHVLNVIDTHRTQALGIHYREAIQELRAEGEKVVGEVVAMASDLGLGAEGTLVEGNPGREICRVAAERGVDVVVVGATGKSGLQEILLGSVSGYVADHARCPVLVVRG